MRFAGITFAMAAARLQQQFTTRFLDASASDEQVSESAMEIPRTGPALVCAGG